MGAALTMPAAFLRGIAVCALVVATFGLPGATQYHSMRRMPHEAAWTEHELETPQAQGLVFETQEPEEQVDETQTEVLPNEGKIADEDVWGETESSASGAAKCALVVKGVKRQDAKACSTKCIVSERKGVVDSMCDHDAGDACKDPGIVFNAPGKYKAIPTDKCVTFPNGLKVTCNMKWDGSKKDFSGIDCPSVNAAAPTPAPKAPPAPAPAKAKAKAPASAAAAPAKAAKAGP